MGVVQPGRTRAAGGIRGLPGIATLRKYEARWLVRDLGAGLVLTTALAPVEIAYAVASGLPGASGLYATIVPLLAYALFGPSRILVLGARTRRWRRSYWVSWPRSPPETQIARSHLPD